MSRWEARELLEACSSDTDHRAWREFVCRFDRRLRCGIIRGLRRAQILPRSELVEDLLQDSYCKLVDKQFRILRRCREQEEKAIGVYLGRVAERVALDYLRAHGAAKRGAGRLVSLDTLMSRSADRLPTTGENTAEELLLLAETYEAFVESCRRAASRRFPERDYRILQLAFFEGLSSREISRCLGAVVTPNCVDSILYRARKRLAAEGFLVARRNSPLLTAPRA